MFDLRASPESPVDSAMFPQFPACYAAASTSASALTKEEPREAAALKQEYADRGCEIEPFAYHPEAAGAPKDASLNSVFGDQDLIDAIMGSLDLESAIAAAPPVIQQQQQGQVHERVKLEGGFMSILREATAEMGRAKVSMTTAPTSTFAAPCARKPGTFLNKDGRWIKGKPCRVDQCDKRAQSNGLCKGHGGGARCSFQGCAKSSQGGGLCRAHGGGKRCMFEGCEKGTQRNGFCYLHGGVRPCGVDGCDKKDRGNGKCFSHGGGRKCQAPLCVTTIRRGVFCDLHNGKLNPSAAK